MTFLVWSMVPPEEIYCLDHQTSDSMLRGATLKMMKELKRARITMLLMTIAALVPCLTQKSKMKSMPLIAKRGAIASLDLMGAITWVAKTRGERTIDLIDLY